MDDWINVNCVLLWILICYGNQYFSKIASENVKIVDTKYIKIVIKYRARRDIYTIDIKKRHAKSNNHSA